MGGGKRRRWEGNRIKEHYVRVRIRKEKQLIVARKGGSGRRQKPHTTSGSEEEGFG